MKFKILIAVLLLSHHYRSLEPSNVPPQASVSATEQRPHPTELEKWMVLQSLKSKLQNLNLEALPTRVQSMIMANDFQLNADSSLQKKIRMRKLTQDAQNNSSIPGVSDVALEVNDALIRNLEIVHAQKRLLLIQFYEVIKEMQSQEGIVDPKIAKLLTSYLQHLAYIYEKANKANEEVPPVIYNYHINQVIAPYCDSPPLELPPEEFLNERDDPLVDAFDGYNMDNMHLFRKTLLQNEKEVVQTSMGNRKLIFNLFNRPWQQQNSRMGNSEFPEKPKETEIYTKSPFDSPIEDHVDEFQKRWVLDHEALRNLSHMVDMLAEEFKNLFVPIERLNTQRQTAIYSEDSKLTIENYDEVKSTAIMIASTDNPYPHIMNQILVSFNNRNPDLDTFLAIYKHPPMLTNIKRLRSEAQRNHELANRISHEDRQIDALVRQLRVNYFDIVTEARSCEDIFHSFSYQTQIIRTSGDSSTYDDRTEKAAIESVKRLIPLLVRFKSTFVTSLQKLSRELRSMEGYEAQLFDTAVALEYKIDMASYHIKVEDQRNWLLRAFRPRKAAVQGGRELKNIKI